MTREIHWERMTGPDVAALAQETCVAVVPVGCIEIHGVHLPTGTDAFDAPGPVNESLIPLARPRVVSSRPASERARNLRTRSICSGPRTT